MSDSPSRIAHASLVLADISGYTSFISQTELEHSQEILTDLLETILKRFRSLLTIHKIEGDAVFGYASDDSLVRGETLLELIELTYTDFRERMKNVRRHTTCACRACAFIPMLDLKFIVHHGDFAFQNIAGTSELAGSDVNLVHRLLKNHVGENTGWRAYALFTQAALDFLRIHPEGLASGSETYEHLGEVRTHTMDLQARYEALMQQRHVVVEEQDALITFAEEMPVSPAVLWSWLNEPSRRNLYSRPGVTFLPVLRPGGRTSAGAITHCVHGTAVDMRERVLDWKPFDYFTVEQDSRPFGIVRVTFRLEPLESGRRTRLRCALTGNLGAVPGFINRPLLKLIWGRLIDYRSVALKLKDLLEQTVAREPVAPLASDDGAVAPANL